MAKLDGALAGCGGWSRRRTLYGGDQRPMGGDDLLDTTRDAARIRAIFVEPEAGRRRVGRAILAACEAAATAAGYARFELMATLPGVPFYAAFWYVAEEPMMDVLPDGTPLRFVRMTCTPQGGCTKRCRESSRRRLRRTWKACAYDVTPLCWSSHPRERGHLGRLVTRPPPNAMRLVGPDASGYTSNTGALAVHRRPTRGTGVGANASWHPSAKQPTNTRARGREGARAGAMTRSGAPALRRAYAHLRPQDTGPSRGRRELPSYRACFFGIRIVPRQVIAPQRHGYAFLAAGV